MNELTPQLGVLPHNHNDLPGQGGALSYEALKDKPDLPTASQLDALAGTSGTPSSSNKYVTNDDVSASATASKIARRDANGEIAVPNSPSGAGSAINATYAGSRVLTATSSSTTEKLSVSYSQTSSAKEFVVYIPGYFYISVYAKYVSGSGTIIIDKVDKVATGGTERVVSLFSYSVTGSFAWYSPAFHLSAGDVIRIRAAGDCVHSAYKVLFDTELVSSVYAEEI